ncbi:MAG: GNAT family N-acetyltransferase [Puniceicoccaceae bacterium]
MIEHVPSENCFRTPEGAVLSYTVKDGRYHFDHTVVPPELRGQGVAGKLATAAFEHARENGWSIVPDCSFIDVFLKRHPEFAELVD